MSNKDINKRPVKKFTDDYTGFSEPIDDMVVDYLRAHTIPTEVDDVYKPFKYKSHKRVHKYVRPPQESQVVDRLQDPEWDILDIEWVLS